MSQTQATFESDLDAGLWVSVAELARMKGLKRQTVHERVRRFKETGALDVRGEGKSLRVNLAQYDLAIGSTSDAARDAAAATRTMGDGDAPSSPSYREAQTREKQYAADLKYLELQRQLGELVPVAEVREFAQREGEAIVRIITSLPAKAETLATAFTNGGLPRLRIELKEIVRSMRIEIADAMHYLAQNAEPWTIDPVHGIQPPQPKEENENDASNPNG